jgi:multiple sugar transport system ATP-binding protein
MASLEIRGATKNFGETKVLKGVDISIEDGEFMVLVGPSGCGKSTLLRMIAGLEGVDSGEIRIGDRLVNWLEPKARDIAMVFQNYALYPHMTVAQNMGFSLMIRGEPQKTTTERVAVAGAILSLDELFARYPRQLSGGQRQRVAMGRAIVRAPQAFLFDEPLSNLDARLRVQMRTEIKALHKRLKTTSVYVTHDQVEAMTMADRIVVMSNGNVEQIGAPLEVYDDPVNTFVASFIGSPSINLIEGTVWRDGDRAAVDVAGGIRLPIHNDIAVATGSPVIYGVRPEHVAVGSRADGFAADVDLVEPTGAETLVFWRIAGTEICARSNERLRFSVGETIGFLPNIDQVMLFEASGARRLRRQNASA